MTGSIVEAIQEPFQAANRIRITVEDAPGPPLADLVCNAFFSGSAPRLRGIRLDSIAFPSPALLLSTNDLVELCLSNVPHGGQPMAPSRLVQLDVAQFNVLSVSILLLLAHSHL